MTCTLTLTGAGLGTGACREAWAGPGPALNGGEDATFFFFFLSEIRDRPFFSELKGQIRENNGSTVLSPMSLLVTQVGKLENR